MTTEFETDWAGCGTEPVYPPRDYAGEPVSRFPDPVKAYSQGAVLLIETLLALGIGTLLAFIFVVMLDRAPW